jgi:hypothetical protein
VIEELELLIVGGRSLSKLCYLGKSTTRSSIKVYSCGRLTKREHLSTYHLPDCSGESVIEMKNIATKPHDTKLMLVATSQSVLLFLRVKAHDHIENYYKTSAAEIGIQKIVAMNYLPTNSALICMEKLNGVNSCLKFIKASCSGEKIEISTETVKLPVCQYLRQFWMGGRDGAEWVAAIDSQNVIHWIYLSCKRG